MLDKWGTLVKEFSEFNRRLSRLINWTSFGSPSLWDPPNMTLRLFLSKYDIETCSYIMGIISSYGFWIFFEKEWFLKNQQEWGKTPIVGTKNRELRPEICYYVPTLNMKTVRNKPKKPVGLWKPWGEVFMSVRLTFRTFLFHQMGTLHSKKNGNTC